MFLYVCRHCFILLIAVARFFSASTSVDLHQVFSLLFFSHSVPFFSILFDIFSLAFFLLSGLISIHTRCCIAQRQKKHPENRRETEKQKANTSSIRKCWIDSTVFHYYNFSIRYVSVWFFDFMQRRNGRMKKKKRSFAKIVNELEDRQAR